MNDNKLINNNWFENAIWLHKNEIIEPKKDNVKRILIIGDSCIWGDGYSNANHIWWQQFKHLLKKEGYSNVEVYAAGLRGYSTLYEFEFILKDKKLMESVDPDLVIIGFVENDPEFRDDKYRIIEKNLIASDIFNDYDIEFVNIFKNSFPNLYSKISVSLSNKLYGNQFFKDVFGLNWDEWLEKICSGRWLKKYEKEVIKPLSEYMDNELKIPYFFYMTNIYEEYPLKNIMNLFDKYNVSYYHVPDLIISNGVSFYFDDKKHMINPVNKHPSVLDCKLFAELLLTVMEENYAEFLGDKVGLYEAQLNINDWMPYSLKPDKIGNNSYVIIYPSVDSENSFLTLPIKKDYVKLNLEDPLKINNIKISGVNVEEIEIFINYIDKELGYDTQEMISLGVKKDNFIWKVDNTLEITSINISAKIKDGESQNLTITIE